ncbi:MAG: hypothetical protein V2A73_23165 [Pseudomonadota bacterium]
MTWSDTVLHVLLFKDGRYQQVAANDDDPALLFTGSRASRIDFKPPESNWYRILVRAHLTLSGGTADLYINDSPVLIGNRFGGDVNGINIGDGDDIRVVGTRRGFGNDFMVFLLKGTETLSALDDDSGPKLYPHLHNFGYQGYAMLVWGLYPGSNGYARLMVQPNTAYLSSTYDGDSVAPDLEYLAGTDPTSPDTDKDGIPDDYEMFGGNDDFRWSFSESASPTRRNAYVEIDWMVGAPNPEWEATSPRPTLPPNGADIFNVDGNTDVYVEPGNAVPWHEYVDFECSAGITDCVEFVDIKASHFSTQYPERRFIFHYAIFAFQTEVGALGLGELFGNDLIVAIPLHNISPVIFNPVLGVKDSEQLGIFIHEFGHNLGLDHNGNESPVGFDGVSIGNSIVHNSVMNYHYTLSGTTTGRYTYSHGTNGCAPCETSPKLACVLAAKIPQVCEDLFTCDCDRDDWSIVDYSPVGHGQWASFAVSLEIAPGTDSGSGDQDEHGHDHRVLTHEDSSVRKTKRPFDPTEELGEREHKYPKETRQDRIDRVAERLRLATSRGLEEGVDFHVSSNGEHLIAE